MDGERVDRSYCGSYSHSVDDEAVEYAIRVARATRRANLELFAAGSDFSSLRAGGLVVPNDLSFEVRTLHMGLTRGSRIQIAHVSAVASTGVPVCVRGMKGVIDSCRSAFRSSGNLRFLQVNHSSHTEEWSEDSGQWTESGGISVPAMTSLVSWDETLRCAKAMRAARWAVIACSGRQDAQFDPREIVKHHESKPQAPTFPPCLDEAREQYDASLLAWGRDIKEWRRVGAERPWNDAASHSDRHGFVGFVQSVEGQRAKVALAVAGGRNLRMDYCYQEGGNTLTGTRVDGTPYALVGLDSVEVSRSLIAGELCCERTDARVSDSAMKMFLALDLGIPRDQAETSIAFVEQPGLFHLDMKVMPLGRGQVLVNNASAARKLAVESGFAPESRERVAIEKRLEDDVEARLISAGLSVVRAPLVHGTDFNFINGQPFVHDGEKHMVTNGASENLQDHARRVFHSIEPNLQLTFTDSEAAKRSLRARGGIRCRVRGEGSRRV